ncbi:MAG: hypothetical protein U0W40_17490 [Acidimicrobiia bacterium]
MNISANGLVRGRTRQLSLQEVRSMDPPSSLCGALAGLISIRIWRPQASEPPPSTRRWTWAHVRRHHLSLVLESPLRDGTDALQLAQHIGATKATVSALAIDLVERGLVEEQEA